MIKKVHRNISESSANGVTNFSLVMAPIILFLLILVAMVSILIQFGIILLCITFLQYNRDSPVLKEGSSDKCADGLFLQYVLFLPLGTLLTCSWALWNQEARTFLYRRGKSGYVQLFSRKSRKVQPVLNRSQITTTSL